MSRSAWPEVTLIEVPALVALVYVSLWARKHLFSEPTITSPTRLSRD